MWTGCTYRVSASYVVNLIKSSHQPSPHTKVIWALFYRLANRVSVSTCPKVQWISDCWSLGKTIPELCETIRLHDLLGCLTGTQSRTGSSSGRFLEEVKFLRCGRWTKEKWWGSIQGRGRRMCRVKVAWVWSFKGMQEGQGLEPMRWRWRMSGARMWWELMLSCKVGPPCLWVLQHRFHQLRIRNTWKPGVVVHICNPSTWEARVGGSWV
jgi:hypothetical protein